MNKTNINPTKIIPRKNNQQKEKNSRNQRNHTTSI